MKIAIINSNCVAINRYTKKGTEIFDYILIRGLAKQAKRYNLEITAFASGDSHLPVPIESVNYKASFADKNIGIEHHKTYEVALASKAFSQQDKFDLYHVNIGNGDIILPFAPFVKKPIIVTMHGSFLEQQYNEKYLSLFRNLENVYFVPISNAQKTPLPGLHYVDTIYHGIDTKKTWTFDPIGNDYIVWAGRAIREKGLDIAIKCIKKTKKKAKLFPLIKDTSPRWIKNIHAGEKNISKNISVRFDVHRHELAHQFQHSKLLLFPIRWEEPFGLVTIEAMACGTPIVAYARGSVSEIVIDGKTGFIVNPSNEEIRGNFIIKKTGIDGLCEAIERIYNMPKEEYMAMRNNCRIQVEKNFTVENMAAKYVSVYKKALQLSTPEKKPT